MQISRCSSSQGDLVDPLQQGSEGEAKNRMATADLRTLLPWLLLLAVSGTAGAAQATPETPAPKHAHHAAHPASTAHGKKAPASTHVRHVKTRRKPRSARSIARSRKLQRAFVASSQLRPMAQELATMRSPAAYAGVTSYAHAHTGEAASAAYMALGHAYLLDRRYPDAVSSFQKANAAGKTLDDYADFLSAQAEMESGRLPDAETLLKGFAAKYPESIFVGRLPVMIANLSLQQNDPQTALRVLHEHAGEAIAAHADFQLALARAKPDDGQRGRSGKALSPHLPHLSSER